MIHDQRHNFEECYKTGLVLVSYGPLSKNLQVLPKQKMYIKRNVKDLVTGNLALHRLLPLRRRYLVNRAGRVRLRYSLGMAAAFILALNAAWGSFAGLASYGESTIASADFWPFGAPETELAYIDGFGYQELSASSLKEKINGSFPDIDKVMKSTGPITAELEIEKGQTLAGLLQKAGISGDDAYNAVKSISEFADPRKILPGQKVRVRLEPKPADAVATETAAASTATETSESSEGGFVLTDLMMPLDKLKFVTLKKDDAGYASKVHEKEVKKITRAGYTTIQTSLYGSAARSGIPSPVIAEVIRIYSWDIDFQRDIRKGDKIEVMYEAYETAEGDVVKYGDIHFANLNIGGRDVALYRFEMENGKTDYFGPDGQSIKKTLMKTPIDGGRITSGFGLRKHPILGYNKMHKGMDFGAPVGTPVYAAGDGTIEEIGRKGAYGNYVRIRHNGRIKTAYAHLHKFAKGMKRGSSVEQGQVVAYVGTTGRSTGPHLHYEVLVNGAQVNPASVDLPTGEQLSGKDMKRFKALVDEARKQYISLSKSFKFASLQHQQQQKSSKKEG